MSVIQVFLKQILTGRDNKTYDIARILWAIGGLVFLFLSIVSVLQHQPWHPVEFGAGFASVLAGGGVGVAIKAKTEPDSKDG